MTGSKRAEEIAIETKGLLFDMDGVLISSIGSVERCWKRWCAIYGVPDAAAFRVPHGIRAKDIMRTLKPEWGEAELADGLRVIEDMEIEDTGDLRVLPGAKALLEKLPAERWAIVTSATRRLLLARLEAAGLPVPERLISGDMVERGKPDPEPSGVGAGVAAGSCVLAVLGTHELSELGKATWVVESLERVAAQIVGDGLELRFRSAGE
jgi:sugar-phosphatase